MTTTDTPTWLASLGRKVDDGDLTPALVAEAEEYLAAYTGTFEFLTDLQRRGRALSPGQARGVLNCWRAQVVRAAQDTLFPAPAADPVTEPGMYLSDGRVWAVVRARAGHLYAKVRDADGGWTYASGGLRRLSAADRITAEQAHEHGARTGICIFCNAELDDADGLGVRVGVGPKCAPKHLGLTQRQLAKHLGITIPRTDARPAASVADTRVDQARRIARASHFGYQPTPAEEALVVAVSADLGPEEFYMDGELFSDLGGIYR